MDKEQIMKKTRLGKILITMVMMMLLFSAMSLTASAYSALPINQGWVAGKLSVEDEVDYFMFRLPSAGLVTLSYQGWDVEYSYYQLQSTDYENIDTYEYIYSSSSSNPKTETKNIWLEAGDYFIKVWAYSDYVGNYRVKADFRSANNTETEPNNLFPNAMSLQANAKVQGLISYLDDVDLYRFQVTSKQDVKIEYTGYIGYSYITLYDQDQMQVVREYVYGASEDSPKKFILEKELNAGTYYIKITPYSNYCGIYQLVWSGKNDTVLPPSTVKATSVTISGNKKVAVGKSFTLKAAVKPGNTTNKAVSWKSSNTSVATVSSKGVVKAKKPGKTTITVTTKDGSKKSKKCTVIVLPKKSSVTLKSPAKKSVKITWKKQSGVSGYEIRYSTSKKFKNYESFSSSSKKATSKTISDLRSKKRYYVQQRFFVKIGSKKYYGSWSSTKSVVVK